MHERLEKIKQHVVDHKTKYIIAGGVVICAATGVVLYRLNKNLAANNELMARLAEKLENGGSITNNVGHTFGNVTESYIDASVTNVIEKARGDSGDVLKNLRTGEIYESRNELRRLKGYSLLMIRRYLNGEIPHLDGDQWEIIGKGEEMAKTRVA